MEQNLVLPTVYRLPIQTPSTEIRLRPGERLATAGEPLKGCILIESGRLKRTRVYRAGEFLHGLAGPGDYLGLEEAIQLEGKAIHRETLEAIGETVVTIVPKAEVEAWMSALPNAIQPILRGSLRSDHPEKYLSRPIVLMPVRARVAATLWLLSTKFGRAKDVEEGRTLDLNLTREEVAHLAGTVYESVIRTLTSLKKEGILDLNGRVIRILNKDELARIGQIVISESHDENSVV